MVDEFLGLRFHECELPSAGSARGDSDNPERAKGALEHLPVVAFWFVASDALLDVRLLDFDDFRFTADPNEVRLDRGNSNEDV